MYHLRNHRALGIPEDEEIAVMSDDCIAVDRYVHRLRSIAGVIVLLPFVH